ncbi:hypothetical protein [Vibrio sp.]|uniref:hypothetical protein n=1 Tax=Vibrio sp. TaxID=678 RepID=UPI00311D845C
MFRNTLSNIRSVSKPEEQQKSESGSDVKVRKVRHVTTEDLASAKPFSNPNRTSETQSISVFKSNPILREAQDADISPLKYASVSKLNQNKKVEQQLGQMLIQGSLGKELTQKAIAIAIDGFGIDFDKLIQDNKDSILKQAYKIGGANELSKGILSLDSVFLAIEDYYLDSGDYDIKTFAQQAQEHNLSKQDYLSEANSGFYKTIGAEPFGPFDYQGEKTAEQDSFSEAMKQRRSNYFNTVTPDNRAFGGTSYHQWYDVNPNRIEKWEKLPQAWRSRILTLAGGSEQKVKAQFESSPDQKAAFLQDIGLYKSTNKFTQDLRPDEVSNGMRRHDAGENSNILRRSQKGMPEVENIVSLALENNRPLISGVSGHTVKFLNAFANVRSYYLSIKNNPSASQDQINEASKKLESLPTLNQARLICMANLMPPKSHHSYFEIMAASEGISDGETKLQFNDLQGYKDIKADDFGAAVYQRLVAAKLL